MKLLEYEGRNLFERYGIPVTRGEVTQTPEGAARIFQKIGKTVVLKAQVPVGGRGKAGGVKLASTRDEVEKIARDILNLSIKGVRVKSVLVAEAIDIAREFYISMTLDRSRNSVLLMASKEGGVEIEEIAKGSPTSIYRDWIKPSIGLLPYKKRKLSYWLFSEKEKQKKCQELLTAMFRLVMDDATLVEINPLALTPEGELVAADSKVILDDNAYFRLKNKIGEKDTSYDDEKEVSAREGGLSYVRMDGNIGCCVNGAGLAMATMDIIKRYGGEPANFLDIGGSSSPEKVQKAMEILLSDKNVRAVFFNIFGGITRCDDVAQGMVQAFEEMKIDVPVVVRLTGTNEDRAKEILKKLSFLIPVSSMAEGAKKAVELTDKQ